MNIIDDLPDHLRGDDWRLLDDDHAYRVGTAEVDGVVEQQGVWEAHRTPSGDVCVGWAQWIGPGDRNWRLISLDPLHIEPSLLCRTCGNHGYIHDGKWVPA